MKILISDTDSGHANTMESNILSICPTATIVKRIENFSDSVDFAVSDGTFDGICRPTTGLSDFRIESSGRIANDAGIWVVHAHASNTQTRYADPSYIGSIISVRGISNSYGPGAEFTTDDSTESDATSYLAGMIAQMLVISSSWSIYDARQALRQTANSWSAGWSEEVGFGLVDWQSAISMSSVELLPINPFGNIQYSAGNGRLYTYWESPITSSGYQYLLVRYDTQPTSESVPGDGTIVWSGSNSSSIHYHEEKTTKYFGYFLSGSYSRLESFSTASISLLGPYSTSFQNRHNTGYTIKIYQNNISKPIKIY